MSLITNIKSLFTSEKTPPKVKNNNPNFITKPSQIKKILQILMESHVQISIVFEDKSEQTSRILDVSSVDITLDQLNSLESHKKMLPDCIIKIYAKHHSVPFIFSTSVIGSSEDDGYIIAMPSKVYHPQKRAFFRTSITNSTKYKFTGAIQFSENLVSGHILDISLGGICIDVQSDSYVKKGVILSPCSLTLSTGNTIHPDFIVRSIRKLPQEEVTRLGCEFIKLKHRNKKAIYKFINEQERAKK